MNVCSNSNLILSSDSWRSFWTIGSRCPCSGRAAEVVVPVRRPGDLRVLAGDQRLGPGDGEVVAERGVDQVCVVVGPGLVVVVELGLDRAGEDGQQPLDPAARPQLQPAAPVQRPAALPGLLILVAARVALPGPRLDVVEPHVLGAGAVGPRLLAGDRAGVAADALVEVHHHAHLGHDLHRDPLVPAYPAISTSPPGSAVGSW